MSQEDPVRMPRRQCLAGRHAVAAVSEPACRPGDQYLYDGIAAELH